MASLTSSPQPYTGSASHLGVSHLVDHSPLVLEEDLAGVGTVVGLPFLVPGWVLAGVEGVVGSLFLVPGRVLAGVETILGPSLPGDRLSLLG